MAGYRQVSRDEFGKKGDLMASNGEIVSFRGTLTAPGGEATGCRIQATKVSMPGTTDFELIHFRLISTDRDLADGPYTLSVNGKTYEARLQLGHLVSASGM